MDSELSNQAILRELELVLSSPEFLRNERQSRFLRFIVERKLEGRLNELKESVIATEVFGRAPDYDPKLDAVVRTEATRLRARLSRYYTSDGVQDPIEIDLPKGGYKPVFKTRILKNSHRRFPRLFPSSSWPLVAVVSILAIVVLGAISLRRAKPAETRPVAFAVDVPPGVQLGHNSPQRGIGTAAPHFAPSPDGRSLAYVAFSGDSKPLLWVRRLDAVGGQPLTGTEDAAFPFWSPDGRFVAFFAEGKLKAIEASGGSVYTICDAPGGQGGTWNRDGDIIFAPSGRSGLFKVSRTGGTASPVTALDPNQLEVSHRWPQFLPDGRHFLYLAVAGPMGGFLVSAGALETRRALYVGSIDSSQRTLLLKGVMRSAYSAGHLLFLRDKTLIAQETLPVG